jgi:hypothetical protein
MELTKVNCKNVRLVNLARAAYYRYRYYGLVFDIWRYLENRQAKKLYKQEKARMAPTPVERKVITELVQTGISIIHIDDLFGSNIFETIRQWAEPLLDAPEVQANIKFISDGGRPAAKSDKFYIVRPLGDRPAVTLKDCIMSVALSDPVLRVVSAYLGMFSRLTAVDLWYNVATGGPDVFSQRWHRDSEDRSIVKTFLYLRDVNETNGPFCYVSGTHKANAFTQKVGRLNYPHEGIIEKKFPSKFRRVCTGRAGTLIFCDTTGYHRGGHPTAEARFLVNAVYASNASEPVASGHTNFLVRAPYDGLSTAAARYAIEHALKHNPTTVS